MRVAIIPFFFLFSLLASAQKKKVEVYMNASDCQSCFGYLSQFIDTLDKYHVQRTYYISSIKPFEREYYVTNYELKIPPDSLQVVTVEEYGVHSTLKINTADSTYQFYLLEYPHHKSQITTLLKK